MRICQKSAKLGGVGGGGGGLKNMGGPGLGV